MKTLQLKLNDVQFYLLLDLLINEIESLRKRVDSWKDIDRMAACNIGSMFLQIVDILMEKYPETYLEIQKIRNVDEFVRFFKELSEFPFYRDTLAFGGAL